MAVAVDVSFYDRWVLEDTVPKKGIFSTVVEVFRGPKSGVARYIAPAIQTFATANEWDKFTLPEFTTMVTSFKLGMDALLSFGEASIADPANNLEAAGPPASPTDTDHVRNAEYLRVLGAACVYLDEIYKSLLADLNGKKSPRIIAHVRDAFRRKLVADPTTAPFWIEIQNLGTVIAGARPFIASNSAVFVAFNELDAAVSGFNGSAVAEGELQRLKGWDLLHAISVRPRGVSGAISSKIDSELLLLPDTEIAFGGAPTGSQALRGVFA